MIDSVLLIRPKGKGKIEFPFGLLYVSTALKREGYQTKIIDLHARPKKENEIAGILLKNKNIMLGISALSGSYFWVKQFTLNLKKKFPRLPVVIDRHIAVMFNLLLEETGIGYICYGEGETVLPALIKRINQRGSIKDVPGIIFKNNGQIIKTSHPPLIREFLLPDFSLLEMEQYFIHPLKDRFFRRDPQYLSRAKSDDKMTTIMLSRGCFSACNFYYRHIIGYRPGSVEWAFKYLMKLYKDYGVHYFRMDDENFIPNIAWLDKLHQKLIKSKIDILFRISGLRVNFVSDELLAKLKEMGCIAVNFGIESGSQKY